MTVFRFSVVEHDLERPWIILGETKHLTVELEHVRAFPAWAAAHWPRHRFTVELDPGQELPALRY